LSARASEDALRYLNADQVDSPAGNLGHLELCTVDDEKLGVLEGVLIDPGARRIRYYVVKSGGWLKRDRYLLPADDVAHVEADQRILRIDATAAALPRETFDAASVPPFSDEDALAAIFAPKVA
jgi:PRC-barrel domain protein